jgi:hypothetical protein
MKRILMLILVAAMLAAFAAPALAGTITILDFKGTTIQTITGDQIPDLLVQAGLGVL